MKSFIEHVGTAVPLRRSNVDTDQIIPAVYLKRVTKTGFSDGLFASWRKDPNFVMNQPQYQGASILVAGTEFGTGSSREHAVWALRDYGFRVVVAPRFGDIFQGNALKTGLLPVELSESQVETLWDRIESDPTIEIAVDLVKLQIQVSEQKWDFHIDEHSRWRLMEGLDDIDLTLRSESEITAFETKRPQWLPTTR